MALLVVGLLVVGHLLGVPILLSYVETDSMEPTIEAGDGFVAVPSGVSGSVEEGDVVVFDAQELDGGGLTTHRVVEVTDEGYVTQGDNNPSPDQVSSEPVVTDGQIVATALQPGDRIVTIPSLGTAVMGLQRVLYNAQLQLTDTLGLTAIFGLTGLSALVLVAGLGLLGVTALADWRDCGRRTRERVRSRARNQPLQPRTIVLLCWIGLCLSTLGTMAALSGTTEVGIVSATFESEAETVIPAGESETLTYSLENGGLVPIVTITEPASEGVIVDNEPTRTARGETANSEVTVTAPDETGYYLRSVSEYRYVGVLPTPVIGSLHAIDSWLARGAVAVTVSGIVFLPLWVTLAFGSHHRSRDRRRAK